MKVIFVYSGNSSSGNNPTVESQAKSLIACGIDIILFPITKKGITGYIGNTLRLAKTLKSEKAQIIHAHYGLSGVVANFAQTTEKLVVSFMGSDLLGEYSVNGRATFRGKLLKWMSLAVARNRADFIIGKTEEMTGVIRRVDKTATVPNGVDISLFKATDKKIARERLNIGIEENVILFIGDSNRPEKNYLLASDAIERTGKKLFLLEVSGKPQEELPLYYSAADVVVLTSLHEGSPNTVKEAMACNCPVVSTPVGDVKYLLDGIQGCYISQGDPLDFAEKINRAIEFAGQHNRTAGRERILSLGLDSVTVANRIKAIYERIIDY